MDETRTLRLAGVPLHAVTEREVIDRIVGGGGGWVVTPNLDIVRQVAGSDELARLVESATLSVADGMPLIWACRLKGSPLPERIAGSTLIQSLCADAARCGLSVYFLGGPPGIAERAAARLRASHSGLIVAGCYCPRFGFERQPADLLALEAALVRACPDIVFVALGFPKQERLIERMRPLLPGAWFVAAGAALNFAAGETPRAPVWLQRVGLEWFHRLCHEPRRLFRRYVVLDLPFAVRVLLRYAVGRATASLSNPRRRG